MGRSEMATYTVKCVKEQKLFSGLIDCMEAERITLVSHDRLMEYADQGICPSVYVDGKGPFFRRKDILDWVKDNLIEHRAGKRFKWTVNIRQETPAKPIDLPSELADLKGSIFELGGVKRNGYVYFLCDAHEIVYVGQSKGLVSRVVAHRQEKKFDRVLYIVVPVSLMNDVERAFIQAINPKYNIIKADVDGDVEKVMSRFGVTSLIGHVSGSENAAIGLE